MPKQPAKFLPAFVARNQAEVAAMFAPDAQFYGTVSPELVTKPEGVRQYFTAALDRPDIALAPKTEILYYVAFVDRGKARRIISLRLANRREVKRYVENL